MNKEQGRKSKGAPERVHNAGADAPSGADTRTPYRFSAARKMTAVTRLLRGEPLEEKIAMLEGKRPLAQRR